MNPRVAIRVRNLPGNPIAGEISFGEDEVVSNGVGNHALDTLVELGDLAKVRTDLENWRSDKFVVSFYDWPEPPRKATKKAAETKSDEQPTVE